MSDDTPARGRRPILIALVAMGALLAAVVVLLIVIINQNTAAAEQRDHERIVAICEDGLADPYGEDLGAMTACLERLEGR